MYCNKCGNYVDENSGFRAKDTKKQFGEIVNIIGYKKDTYKKFEVGNIKVYLGNDQDIRKKMSDAIQIYKSGRVTSYIKVGFEGTPDFK